MKYLAYLTLLLFIFGCTDNRNTITNGVFSLTFSPSDGKLISMVDDGSEMIDSASVGTLPWVFLKNGRNMECTPRLVSLSKRNSRNINLKWDVGDSITVDVEVELDRREAFSYWSATVSGTESVDRFACPCISGLKAREDEKFAMGDWTGFLWQDVRGALTDENPIKTYPTKMGMIQLVAIYGKDSPGLYCSADDTLCYLKRAVVSVDSSSTCYMLENVLPQNGEFSYTLPYRSVIGAFDGDWYDAARIYRKWAIAQDRAKNSRMKTGKTASWASDTDIWVWNRGTSDNVLTEAADLQDYLGGMNVNVLWHWWHNCLYDDTFPEYLPPREGAARFKAAVDSAKARGINALVYMNAYQWGDQSESWSREGAEAYKAVERDGSDHSYVYNKFTGHALTPMCMGTEFWRNKYSSMAAEAINEYGVGGIYMDQLSSTTYTCYNPSHGHSVGGGNYWTEGGRKLIDRIRELTAGKEVVLAGEGHSEQYFQKTDLCLTLQGSWERYHYTPTMQIIPLFEAIYHDYAQAFGSYTSLTYPPYDEKWPAELRPANCEKLLPETYNTQFRLELAKTFVWGIQPMIANYHTFLRKERPAELEYLRRLVKTRSSVPEYLNSGEMMRTPRIESEVIEFDNSKISLYAGRNGGDMLTSRRLTTPSLYSGAWRSAQGNIAVAVSNITEKVQPLKFLFDPALYGLKGKYDVEIINADGRSTALSDCSGLQNIDMQIDGCESIVIEFKQ